MKYLIITGFLLFSIMILNAQTTERWSQAYNRYEYYDSRGNLIGYKKKDIYGQWQYFDLRTSNNQSNSYKYPEYQNPYDTGLIERALSQRQQAFDQKVQNIQNKINSISEIILYIYKNCDPSKKESDKMTYYLDEMGKLNTNMVDTNYSNIMNWLNRVEKDVESFICD